MIWTHSIPQPPVPQFLRETLKDYPELIQEIQDVLTKVVMDGPASIPPFEWAIWRIEDTLSALYSDAYEALKEAEQIGDSQAIYRAKIKADAVSSARHLWDLEDLREYFQTYKGALE
jgi:hypothetical protein